jgi:hypothetical protein
MFHVEHFAISETASLSPVMLTKRNLKSPYALMLTKNARLPLLLVALFLLSDNARAAGPPAEFDHVWIMVSAGAPERAALKKAGFTISPVVNRHEGQGTASVTAEFQNAFLELMWVEPTVPVAPGGPSGAKAHVFGALGGTAEAVPSQNPIKIRFSKPTIVIGR